ncbi:MAG: hypothetical protein WHX52_08285 [Anaerolineae bacterium]
MNPWLWLPAGFVVAVLNVASIAGTVSRLRPGGEGRALSLFVSGFALRLVLSLLVLMAALQHSATAGLLAFAGLWVGRWTVLFLARGPAHG